MTKKYFGTDGIRGRVGQYPITPEFVLKLGWAAGCYFASNTPPGERAKILIGKDTRISGYMFESALEAGLVAAGVDVMLLGPMPTPAIAYLTRTFHAQAGIVISASHNPFDDNGIKFFAGDGQKLDDEIESQIEQQIDKDMQTVDSARLGKVWRIEDAAGRYIEFCKSTVPGRFNLNGMKMVVDCAHGATYHVAPSVFRELGAQVITIGTEPDGLNINEEVGSTDPAALQQAVLRENADLGVAFDGDGDRVMFVDAHGAVIDGDELLYIIVQDQLRSRGKCSGVVGTLMTNFGFELAMKELNVPFARAKVGDRYVNELMQDRGWQLGGESSGHIICSDVTTTGDGIIAALKVLFATKMTGKGLRELLDGMNKMPQTMINVSVAKKVDLARHDGIQSAVRETEAELANTGRVLLRASGTEPVIRVMIEGRDANQVARLCRQLADLVTSLLS
jgi:phosphoglucosamine mutase